MAVLSEHQEHIIQTTSRISSVFSLLGASFIIITFCCCKDFHRPINRLAFYASWGNIATNVATMMSIDGIRGGQTSATCQVQGLLIQWMIPADALFCLCMAINVYLTVFRKLTTSQLRRLEPYYIAVCYGIPAVPAFTFLFYRPPSQSPIYGEATLWCWIAPEWRPLRIGAFYGPVWLVVILTFIIYLLVGRVVFQMHASLKEEETTLTGDLGTRPSVCGPRPPEKARCSTGGLSSSGADGLELGEVATRASSCAGYECTIQAEAMPRRTRKLRSPALEANRAAWAYCRCAFLFFLALLITWLPSSINRMHTLHNPNGSSMSYEFAAALVLPAQGFWNGVIYVVTTWSVCKDCFWAVWGRLRRIGRPGFGRPMREESESERRVLTA